MNPTTIALLLMFLVALAFFIALTEVLANRHILAFFKKISCGFFGGFGGRSAFRHFHSVVTACYHASCESPKFAVREKPTRNSFGSVLAQELAAA